MTSFFRVNPYGTTCNVAAVRGGVDQILVYKGNETICRDRGCTTSANTVAKELYHTVAAIHKFFWVKFDLEGIDGKGEIPPLQIGWEQDNAQWICTSSLAHSCYFRFNNRYATQSSVVAHEYMHGIIARLCPLKYENQSGALNESCADVFGKVFNYWYHKDRSWKIAERDLSQFAHVDSLRPFTRKPSHLNDYGNVHTNSSLPSHAFFTAVSLIDEPRDGRIAQVWFGALMQVAPNETFVGFAKKTLKQARFYYDQDVVSAVKEAWIHVGLLRYRIPRTTFKHPIHR